MKDRQPGEGPWTAKGGPAGIARPTQQGADRKQEEQRYNTPSISIATWLLARGHTPHIRVQVDGRCEFSFVASRDLEIACNEFAVAADFQRLEAARRELREKMQAAKKLAGGTR